MKYYHFVYIYNLTKIKIINVYVILYIVILFISLNHFSCPVDLFRLITALDLI